jgi:hypothetical protein
VATRDDTIETAAMALHKQMEAVDPSGDYRWDEPDERNWFRLSHHERAFYIHTIRRLIACEGEVLLALGNLAAPRDDLIKRRSLLGK